MFSSPYSTGRPKVKSSLMISWSLFPLIKPLTTIPEYFASSSGLGSSIGGGSRFYEINNIHVGVGRFISNNFPYTFMCSERRTLVAVQSLANPLPEHSVSSW